MYLVQLDRQGTVIKIDEVEYLGFINSKETRSYEDYNVRYHKYEQKLFKISFLTKQNEIITIKEDNHEWTGQRGYDTDEHYGCGAGESPYIDIYFTTQKEKVEAFLKQVKFIERFMKHKKEMDDMFNELIPFIAK